MAAQLASNVMPTSSSLPLAASHTRSSGRLALLDTSRLFAAAGIVWVHATTSGTLDILNPLGTFGVPFYIFVAILFMARGLTREPRQTLWHYVVSRVWRVYLPFAAWTAIYVALNEAKSLLVDRTLAPQQISVIYAGGQQHLWFLPFLMVTTIIGAVLVRLLEYRRLWRLVTITLLVLLGAASAIWPEPAWVAAREPHGDMEFWRFALRALPSVFWAMAIGLACAINGSLPRTNAKLAIGGAVLFAGALITQSVVQGSEIFAGVDATKPLRAAAGLGILLIALWPVVMPGIERFGRLGRYSYGIYLSHLLFIRIVVLWTERFDIKPSVWLDLLTFAVAFGSALGISMLFAKSKYTRWMLGE